jgi:hypothetical protein
MSPVPATDSRYSRDHCLPAKDKHFIRVFLLRQIIVSIFGQRAWRTCVIGEGSLRSLPPFPSDLDPQSEDRQTVDWDGEVRCDEGVQAGGFNVGNLTVKVSRTFPAVLKILFLHLRISLCSHCIHLIPRHRLFANFSTHILFA